MLEGQSVSFAITSDLAGQSIQPGVALNGEDAPAASVTAITDTSGIARAVLTSGSDVGPVTVAVAANGQTSQEDFVVEKAQSQWTATPVDPDSDEDPIVRLSLQFAGLPVNGHPISWKISRVRLYDGEIVPVGTWNEYARFRGLSAAGEAVSTTGAHGVAGEAAAYAHFSLVLLKIEFGGDDKVVFVSPALQSGALQSSAPDEGPAPELAAAVQSVASKNNQKHAEEINIRPVHGKTEKSLRANGEMNVRKRSGTKTNSNNVLARNDEVELVTQGFGADKIRVPFGVEQQINVAFDIFPSVIGNSQLISSLKIQAHDVNGDLLEYMRNIETGEEMMTVNGQPMALNRPAAIQNVDPAGSIKYFFEFFAPALGDAWLEDNYTVKGRKAQAKRVYVTVKNLGIGFYKGGKGLVDLSTSAIDAAFHPREAWSKTEVFVNGIQNKNTRDKLVQSALDGFKNEYDLMYSDAVNGNGEKFAAFAGQSGGQVFFDAAVGFGVGKAAQLGKGTALYAKVQSAATKTVRIGTITLRASLKNTGRIARVITPVVKPLRHVGIKSWKYSESTAVFARKALSSPKARIACYVKNRGYVVLVRAEKGKGILGRNKFDIPCEYARIFGKLDPKTKKFIAEKIELIARIACFTKGTPVLMADGTHRAIEQIKVGDLVMSRDEATGATSAQKVVQTFEKQAAATLVLHLKNGETIETTPEHPFYVESQGFTPAGEMGIGTSIVTRAGPSATLASSQVRERAATVYNFEVENTHTYFVGQSDLWVHNFCSLDGLKWKWASKKTFGHAFLRHGKQQLQPLIDRARTKGPQGRWLDNEAAATFLEGKIKDFVARGIHEGAHTVNIPEGLGEIITIGADNVPIRTAATKAKIVFEDSSLIYDSQTGKGVLLKGAHPYVGSE